MPDICDPNAILQGASCFDCIPDGLQDAAMTYELAAIEYGDDIPSTQSLLNSSSCYRCLDGIQLPVQVYLLAPLAGVSPTVSALSATLGCTGCIPIGMTMEANLYLLAQILSSGEIDELSETDLQTLPQDATCFLCLEGSQAQIQTMLLNQISGMNYSIDQLSQFAGSLTCLGDGTLQMVRTALLCQWLKNKIVPSLPFLTWTPSSAVAQWVDKNGVHTTDYTTFAATVDQASFSSFELASTTVQTIYGSLTTIGGWEAKFCNSLTSVSLPNLSTTTNGGIGLDGCPLLTTLDLPSLVSTSGPFSRLSFPDCTSLVSVNLPSLASIGDIFDFHGCTSLVSILNPNLNAVVGGTVIGNTCPNLTTVQLALDYSLIGGGPTPPPNDNASVDLTGAALSVASISTIINSLFVSWVPGQDGSYFTLDGGTNAGLSSLSATTQSHYASLLINGCHISLNP